MMHFSLRMPKPRVVILSAFLTPFRSGAEACAEEVPLRLTDQFDFTIVTARLRRDLPREDSLSPHSPSPNGGGGHSGVRVVRVGIGCKLDKWLYPFLAPLEAKKFNPQLVHAILETFAGEALMRCKKVIPQAKRILTLKTTNRTFRKKKIIQSADIVTAISKHLADIAVGMGRADVTIIPNGIDYAAIRLACDKYKKIPGRILFVGRLEKMKGVDLLLNAFAQLQSPECRLHVVGDGSQARSLKKLATQLGIADRVTFKGYLQTMDVYREYAEAEIFCGISRSEALGNVFLEALAAGCAVVGTSIGGIVEIVQAGAAGILVRPEVSAVTGALKKVLDIDVRKAFAQEGRLSAAKYDWNLIANRYAEIYKSFTLPKA